jgi:hypothetical protein
MVGGEVMGKSIAELGEEVVEKLRARGEQVLRPPCIDLWEDDEPDIYVKNHLPFVCGTAIPGKDGTYIILHDHLAYQKGPFKFEELGLCDAYCWYQRKKLDDYYKSHDILPGQEVPQIPDIAAKCRKGWSRLECVHKDWTGYYGYFHCDNCPEVTHHIDPVLSEPVDHFVLEGNGREINYELLERE